MLNNGKEECNKDKEENLILLVWWMLMIFCLLWNENTPSNNGTRGRLQGGSTITQ
jgi:hypothetical protein